MHNKNFIWCHSKGGFSDHAGMLKCLEIRRLGISLHFEYFVIYKENTLNQISDNLNVHRRSYNTILSKMFPLPSTLNNPKLFLIFALLASEIFSEFSLILKTPGVDNMFRLKFPLRFINKVRN